MKENLRVTHYSNGIPINKVTLTSDWINLSSPGYCWFNNDSSTHANPYGAIYNGYSSNANGLCPSGWHVPSDSEWSTLTDYCGGASIAADKLKESGTAHWLPTNYGTNSTGFTAIGGGIRLGTDGSFTNLKQYGFWWTSTGNSTTGYRRTIYNNTSAVATSSGVDKKHGLSIRCIMD